MNPAIPHLVGIAQWPEHQVVALGTQVRLLLPTPNMEGDHTDMTTRQALRNIIERIDEFREECEAKDTTIVSPAWHNLYWIKDVAAQGLAEEGAELC